MLMDLHLLNVCQRPSQVLVAYTRGNTLQIRTDIWISGTTVQTDTKHTCVSDPIMNPSCGNCTSYTGSWWILLQVHFLCCREKWKLQFCPTWRREKMEHQLPCVSLCPPIWSRNYSDGWRGWTATTSAFGSVTSWVGALMSIHSRKQPVSF